MRYLIKFSYDGSKFYGFQRQSDKKTVQGEIEKALTIINKGRVDIKGSGRTDVGVHAMGQCAHFDLGQDIPEDRLMKALNSIVRPYIDIKACSKVCNDFHARFMVKSKTYVYKIWLGDFSPFKEDYYLQYDKSIDIEKLKQVIKLFIGDHNFHNFVSGVRDNYNASIFDIDLNILEDEIDIIFKGKGFYRYMVRNLVGAILDVNEGKCDIMLVERMLKSRDFNYQLSTAPAKGLYLEGVYYDA